MLYILSAYLVAKIIISCGLLKPHLRGDWSEQKQKSIFPNKFVEVRPEFADTAF